MAMAMFEYTVALLADKALKLLHYNETNSAKILIEFRNHLRQSAPLFIDDLQSSLARLLQHLESTVQDTISYGHFAAVQVHQHMQSQHAISLPPLHKRPRPSTPADKSSQPPLNEVTKQLLEACKTATPKVCLGYVYTLLDDASRALLTPRNTCQGQSCPANFSHAAVRLPEGLKYKS